MPRLDLSDKLFLSLRGATLLLEGLLSVPLDEVTVLLSPLVTVPRLPRESAVVEFLSTRVSRRGD